MNQVAAEWLEKPVTSEKSEIASAGNVFLKKHFEIVLNFKKSYMVEKGSKNPHTPFMQDPSVVNILPHLLYHLLSPCPCTGV